MAEVNGAAQLRRLIRLIRMLSDSPQTLRRLARCLDVSDRTIQRDLKILQSIGYRIGQVDGPGRQFAYQITHWPPWAI